jgi:hypothetical protein
MAIHLLKLGTFTMYTYIYVYKKIPYPYTYSYTYTCIHKYVYTSTRGAPTTCSWTESAEINYRLSRKDNKYIRSYIRVPMHMF